MSCNDDPIRLPFIPFVERSTKLLVALGLVAISLSFAPPCGNLIPSREAMRAHVALAARVYATGGYLEILELLWHETLQFIFPSNQRIRHRPEADSL
jgi:hypothetical protein